MINTTLIAKPCAESARARMIPGSPPLAAAFVVPAAGDLQIQGTGLPTRFGDTYHGQGSRAWSPPD